MDDKRFEELLKLAISHNITEDDEEELCDTYIYPETAELFPYIQSACDHKYFPAYYSMGNVYENGAGCEKSMELALFFWKLSIAAGGFGYTGIGNCYRTGVGGVKKCYETAVDYYQKAIEHWDAQPASVSAENLLLIPDRGDYFFIADKEIDVDWWEFVIEKFPDRVNRFVYINLANRYGFGTEQFEKWMKKAEELEEEPFHTKINKASNHDDDLLEDDFMDEDLDDEDEDWDDYDSFECRCCHRRILREDVEDPETDICDDCRYSGNELARD